MISGLDTIAALATPLSASGIGIIRVSGQDAIRLIDRIYRGKRHLSDCAANSINYGHIVDFSGRTADEVLVSVFRAPHSYTGEDSVEINCHGGIYVLRKVLSLVFETGIREADPGEFSKRAFLNGRMDLSEADSVMELISAESEASYQNSLRQLSGFLSEKVNKIRSEILHEAAFVEAALDDPEHYDLDGFDSRLTVYLHSWIDELRTLADSYREGSLIKDGIVTVISGRPNVGKSSLLNFLSGRERAIVTDIPGTTRDMIEERVVLGDLVLRLTDTAGIRETSDAIEQIGVEKARKAQSEAELVLYLVDSSIKLSEEDRVFLKKLDAASSIVLLSKSDLETLTDSDDICHFFSGKVVEFSSKTGEGRDELTAAVNQLFFDGGIDSGQFYLTSERNFQDISAALKSLSFVEKSIADGLSEDFFTADLYDAYKSLGYILGEDVKEDLVDKVFADFCMGK